MAIEFEARAKMSLGHYQFRSRIVPILLAWPFVAALVVLITNDLYLKLAYPGWLTGKLSDFSGVYLIAALAIGLFPKRKFLAAATVALAFFYWKSPASQWLIDSINSVSQNQIGRVVDYTDLIALISIPVAWFFVSSRGEQFPSFSVRQLLSIPIAVITVLAITGTSVLWPAGEYSIRNTDLTNRIEEAEIVGAIERVVERFNLKCENCGEPADETIYSNEDIHFAYSMDEAANGIRFEIRVNKMKGIIMRRPDYDLFDSFMRSLKSEMGQLSSSMEFVQSLSGPRYNY